MKKIKEYLDDFLKDNTINGFLVMFELRATGNQQYYINFMIILLMIKY